MPVQRRAQRDPHQRGDNITSRVLHGLPEHLASQGLNSKLIAERFGADWAALLERNAFVSFEQFVRTLDLAAELANDGAFGVRWAQVAAGGCEDISHYIQCNSPNLKGFLEARTQYSAIVTDAYSTRLVTNDKTAFYVWDIPRNSHVHKQVAGYLVGLLVSKVRHVLGKPDWFPRSVQFAYGPGVDYSRYHKILGPRIRFSAQMTAVEFDAAELLQPLPKADPLLRAEMCELARVRLTHDDQH